jgi:REP element-mobilizing transposase RayT
LSPNTGIRFWPEKLNRLSLKERGKSARATGGSYGWELLEIEVMPEHVHLFVLAPPKIAPLQIASTLKSILAVDVFRAFPLSNAQETSLLG